MAGYNSWSNGVNDIRYVDVNASPYMQSKNCWVFKNNIQFSTTLGQDWNSIVVGGYQQQYGGTPKMNVAEVIWVSGILSAGDKTLLQAYVSTKYAV